MNGSACPKAQPALLPGSSRSCDSSRPASITFACILTTQSARTTVHSITWQHSLPSLRDYAFINSKLSPDKSRIGAARVDFLGHVISADGVRPNDDRVAALTRMPMPTDIKQLRSLLGGLSYYRKFLPNMPTTYDR